MSQKKKENKSLCVLMFCLFTVVVPGAYRGQKMEAESPGIRVMDGCESLCGAGN